MYAPRFRLRSFDGLEQGARELVLRFLLEGLINVNVAYLRAHPETPWLYDSGVTYAEEDEGTDDWNDIPQTRALGVGDCEDLAAWRIAELRVRCEEAALPVVTTYAEGARVLYHVTVRHPGGRIEHPSRALGLR